MNEIRKSEAPSNSLDARGSTVAEASKKRSCLGTFAAVCGLCLSLVWILNIGCGIVEIPDNLPIVGNLDEAFFTLLFVSCLSYLGIEIPFLSNIIKNSKKR